MAFNPINSWQIEGEKVEAVTDFFLGSKISVDSDFLGFYVVNSRGMSAQTHGLLGMKSSSFRSFRPHGGGCADHKVALPMQQKPPRACVTCRTFIENTNNQVNPISVPCLTVYKILTRRRLYLIIFVLKSSRSRKIGCFR